MNSDEGKKKCEDSDDGKKRSRGILKKVKREVRNSDGDKRM